MHPIPLRSEEIEVQTEGAQVYRQQITGRSSVLALCLFHWPTALDLELCRSHKETAWKGWEPWKGGPQAQK